MKKFSQQTKLTIYHFYTITKQNKIGRDSIRFIRIKKEETEKKKRANLKAINNHRPYVLTET